MDEIAPPPAAPAFRDQTTGLQAFGILYIMVGGLAALAVPILAIFLLIMEVTRKPFAASLPALLLLLTLAATMLVWLGIGSFLGRRWARALILCQSWIGLFTGAVQLFSLLATTHFAALAATVPPSPPVRGYQSPLTHAIVLLVTYALLVIWTGSQVLFYGSAGARGTCERLDPKERWTDRCPLPVLGACVLLTHVAQQALGYGASLQIFPLAGGSVAGAAAIVLWVAFAAFALFSAVAFYRRQPAIWWIYLLVYAAVMLSLIAAYHRSASVELFRLSALSDAGRERMSHTPALQRNTLVLGTALMAAGNIAYLCWIRPYFRRSPSADQ